jgi:hypothetical protein
MGVTDPPPRSGVMNSGYQNLEADTGRETLEHGNVSTTRIYTDFLDRAGGRGVRDPLERF